MLTHLSVNNIALVDKLSIDFEPGLTVLTGETGAGKSVIVTAIALVLGSRAEREYVRHGAAVASVEAEFDITSLGPAYRKQYADYITDGNLSVRREIRSDGSSKARIAGDPSTIGRLREVTSPIAEILGQHANQMLMNEDNHLGFLDHFASLEQSAASTSELFNEWRKIAAELNRFRTRRDQLVDERELLLFQRDEIEKSEIKVGEEDELLREKKKLDSSRTLMESAEAITEIFDSERPSVMPMLRQIRNELDKMTEIDPELTELTERLSDVDFQLDETRQAIERYGATVSDNPARLVEINERLDELYALKRKYGGTEQSILELLELVRVKLRDRPDIDAMIDQLTSQCEDARKSYATEALALSEARLKAADYLAQLVRNELKSLAIENGGFQFEFSYEDDDDGILMNDRTVRPFAHGLETGRILFSANKGEPLRSLVKTASGGEISRVLLAMKSAEKKNHKALHPLLVFDEVDAGIGGQTATEVGTKIKKLSEKRQVLVITHLHQIARQADHHISVIKETDSNDRATISIAALDSSGTAHELKRMLALPE
ncbi:MAG: DNA repair protein RecN [candidate division Zixibacteria bacterium]